MTPERAGREVVAVRVCVLAQASPGTWVEHYVSAFRRACDTIVVGPAPEADALRSWGRDQAAHLVTPNDIPYDFEREDVDLLSLLPTGWTPDLVVGIAGIGGDPLYSRVAQLPCPTAFISTDTWQCLLDYREAVRYDLVFVAQREFIPHLRATGSRHVYWLPLACDPEVHHPVDRAPTHDIVFAGTTSAPVYRERRRLLEALRGRFSLFTQEAVFGEDLCEAFARGRLAFNHSAVQELNMRIFEALGMGCVLLTNAEAEHNGLFDLFEDGKHLIAYCSEADLIGKAEMYLADDAARCAVAAAGRTKVLAQHTYAHRVETLLQTVRELTADLSQANEPVIYPGESLGAALTPAAARHQRYCGERISDYLPTIPGAVVDYGLGLDVSKVALRRRGVGRLVGLAVDPGAAARRRGSYDEILPFPAASFGAADTVVIAAPEALHIPMYEALRRAHALLYPGGTLVLRLRGTVLLEQGLRPEPAMLSAWLEAADFHLRLAGPALADGGCVLLARKRTRRLAGIVEELFTRLQVPEIDLSDLIRRIPPGW